MEINYEMEELVEIVAELAEEYTGKESTSITYEKAEQLMEAVLYCIRATENEALGGEDSYAVIDTTTSFTAKEAYLHGYRLVVEKTQKTLEKYNQLMMRFDDYGNRCLYDTVVKGIPEFFKWYDARFFPQNTILCLDYPVREDLSRFSGIDRIDAYLDCIINEQNELQKMGRGVVIQKLLSYSEDYQELIENLTELIEYRPVNE